MDEPPGTHRGHSCLPPACLIDQSRVCRPVVLAHVGDPLMLPPSSQPKESFLAVTSFMASPSCREPPCLGQILPREIHIRGWIDLCRPGHFIAMQDNTDRAFGLQVSPRGLQSTSRGCFAASPQLNLAPSPSTRNVCTLTWVSGSASLRTRSVAA